MSLLPKPDNMQKAAILTGILLLSGAAAAQVKVGDPAATVEADALFNCPYGGLDALKGKLVLYFWFIPESSASRKLSRDMSSLLARHRSQGFEIVGISHRDVEQIENWVKRRKPRFIVAWEPSNISMGTYLFQQWPISALVDPRGKVVYKGPPSRVSDALIKKHLRGARGRGPNSPMRLTLDLPRSLWKVTLAVEKGKLAKALKLLEAVLKNTKDGAIREAAKGARRDVKRLIDNRLEEAAEALRGKRFYQAQLAYERVLTHASGTKQAATAKKALAGFRKDAQVLREIRGGKILRKAERALDGGQTRRAEKLLKSLDTSQWDGTDIRKRAKQLLKLPVFRKRR
jgi:peroxiredoxin